MSPPTAAPAAPVQPRLCEAQALFKEAQRRRRRRWLAGITAVLVASAAAAVSSVTWLHRPAGHEQGSSRTAGTGQRTRSSAAVVWVDDRGRLRVGDIQPGSPASMTQRAVAEVTASAVPLVRAGERVYWVNPSGAFVPALGHWSQLVQYLDLATGRAGTAGPGQTVFASPGGRYLFMSQTATSLTETPVTGAGTPRQLNIPRGWYLPGGNGLADPMIGEGLATANGIIVQSAESPGCCRSAQTLAIWNPRSGQVTVIGRERAVIDAYTPPGAGYSLLAWLPAACPFPDNCQLRITNTATLSTRTVRSPRPGGFAMGGAFSPDGTRLAVFLNAASARAARLALVDAGTGAVRVARRPLLMLGLDIGWARWLPDGTHLIMGATTRAYLVDSATLSARPFSFASGRGHNIGYSRDVNYSAAVVPLRR